MRIYHFTEQPYPDAWRPEAETLRVTLPSSECDPEVLHGLIHRYLDEWVLADELGFDIMVNEHHSTATCLSVSANLTLAILARITKRARLLALGIPIANRADPIRVAEEMAMIDVMSHGRLEMGLVKGVPYEIAPANLNPVRMMDRFWEAHDLILKAMATHDGPFSWEGEYFHYRTVNVWPRSCQEPHPPVWITSLSPSSAPEIARRGHVVGTVLNGLACKKLFDAYRTSYLEFHGRPAGLDRFGYAMLCAVGNNREEAFRRAQQVATYLKTSDQVKEPFNMPPGYLPPQAIAQMMRTGGKVSYSPVPTLSGKTVFPKTATVEELIDAGIMCAGTPDEVFDQITSFQKRVGGFGHLILMFQAGALNHKDTTDSLTLFGREVLPRINDWARDQETATPQLLPEIAR